MAILGNKNKKKNSDIEYISVGTLRAASSPFANKDEIPIRTVTNKAGRTYAIPVNPKTGKVPADALYARFLNESEGTRDGHNRNIAIDIGRLADTVHIIPKKGYTPEELIKTGWWAYPAESDILGIDDPSSSVFGAIMGASSKRGREAGKKIAIISPEEERIRTVLSKNFTGSELNNAVRDSGILITTGSAGRGASGFYRYKQPGMQCPQIVLEPSCDEDTITHEFIHHMRFVDEGRGDVSRTPYPVDDSGQVDVNAWRRLTADEISSLRNMEEAATVAEATLRTREPCGRPTGYYQHIEGHSPRNTDITAVKEMYAHDRSVLTSGPKGSKPQRGKRATKRVNDKFLDTNISKLKMGGTSAAKSVEVKRAKGSMPKAKAPVKKQKPDMTVPMGPAPVPATARTDSRKKKTKQTTLPKKTVSKNVTSKNVSSKNLRVQVPPSKNRRT